jgi:RNA polymerase sigma-70 factor, ECF subfamily
LGPEEFESFFLSVYPQLVRYVRQFHDPSVAEDLASKTLEDIWKRAEPAPTDDHSFYRLRKLAFAILRGHIGHQARSQLAQRRRERAFAADHALQPGTPDVAEEVVELDWPEWTHDLRDDERQLLDLHANGYKPGEIAPIIGVTPPAVSARLQRVKSKARELWQKKVNGDGSAGC